jgi:hypothetical protein
MVRVTYLPLSINFALLPIQQALHQDFELQNTDILKTKTKISAVMAKQSWCEKCLSMTAKIEGLQALTSKEGYLHYNKQELSESVGQGCCLCKIISSHCGATWKKEQHTRLRFFAEAKDREKGERLAERESDNHPFEGRHITSLYAIRPISVPLAIFSREGIICLFLRTLQGEYC